MNDEAVYRAAPATLGLLKSDVKTPLVGIQSTGPQKFHEVIERGLARFSAFWMCS